MTEYTTPMVEIIEIDELLTAGVSPSLGENEMEPTDPDW